MRLKFLLSILGFLLPLGAAAQVTISNTAYASGQTQTIYSPTTIATSGTVAVSAGANITFVAATRITLAPGFKVAVNGRFLALSSADADGDGMPNDWEIAHGLNPAVNDAAGDADGDGLSNLSEYQLGTNPGGGASNTTDPSQATTQLKVHRPN